MYYTYNVVCTALESKIFLLYIEMIGWARSNNTVCDLPHNLVTLGLKDYISEEDAYITF